jgi:hypothetical protein
VFIACAGDTDLMQSTLRHLSRLKARLLKSRGTSSRQDRNGYVLFQYLDEVGSFDYEKYRRIQEEGNKRKLAHTWATEQNIKFVARWIRDQNPAPKFGLCHGTRRGLEQKWFSEVLGCSVIGTEISDTASQFENTLHWDFHEVRPEWLDACDFIYSNSFDHSYDPKLCLNRWMSCLAPNGFCVIEHTSMHDEAGASELDPFGASIMAMPYLVLEWGEGRFSVRKIIDAPEIRDRTAFTKFLIIQRD